MAQKWRNVLKHRLCSLENCIWSALFVDSLSMDCAVFVDRFPAFRPADLQDICIETKNPRIGHFLAALGPVPALTAFSGDFSIGSQRN